jgi:hypothetical protein
MSKIEIKDIYLYSREDLEENKRLDPSRTRFYCELKQNRIGLRELNGIWIDYDNNRYYCGGIDPISIKGLRRQNFPDVKEDTEEWDNLPDNYVEAHLSKKLFISEKTYSKLLLLQKPEDIDWDIMNNIKLLVEGNRNV